MQETRDATTQQNVVNEVDRDHNAYMLYYERVCPTVPVEKEQAEQPPTEKMEGMKEETEGKEKEEIGEKKSSHVKPQPEKEESTTSTTTTTTTVDNEETSQMLVRIMHGLKVVRTTNEQPEEATDDDRHQLHGLKQYRKEVWVENASIQKKRLLYKKSYFDFLLNLGELCCDEDSDNALDQNMAAGGSGASSLPTTPSRRSNSGAMSPMPRGTTVTVSTSTATANNHYCHCSNTMYTTPSNNNTTPFRHYAAVHFDEIFVPNIGGTSDANRRGPHLGPHLGPNVGPNLGSVVPGAVPVVRRERGAVPRSGERGVPVENGPGLVCASTVCEEQPQTKSHVEADGLSGDAAGRGGLPTSPTTHTGLGRHCGVEGGGQQRRRDGPAEFGRFGRFGGGTQTQPPQ